MEEKERKQLKKRLLGLVINEPPYPYPITMAEVMVNDMSKPNLKPLLNFIEQELDKAREEGARDVLERILENIPVCRNLNGYEGEGWIMEDDLRNILSKLTTK